MAGVQNCKCKLSYEKLKRDEIDVGIKQLRTLNSKEKLKTEVKMLIILVYRIITSPRPIQ